MKHYLILLLTLLSFPCFSNDGKEVPIIANDTIGRTDLLFEEIQSIFTFKKTQWRNSIPITVVLMPVTSDGHRHFLKKYVGLGVTTYFRRMNNLVHSGRNNEPKIVKTNEEMLKHISTITGSIGYLKGFVYFNSGDRNIIVVEVR